MSILQLPILFSSFLGHIGAGIYLMFCGSIPMIIIFHVNYIVSEWLSEWINAVGCKLNHILSPSFITWKKKKIKVKSIYENIYEDGFAVGLNEDWLAWKFS